MPGLPSVLLAARKRYTLEIQFLGLGEASMYGMANVLVPVRAAIFHISLPAAADCSNKLFIKKKKNPRICGAFEYGIINTGTWNAWGIA